MSIHFPNLSHSKVIDVDNKGRIYLRSIYNRRFEPEMKFFLYKFYNGEVVGFIAQNENNRYLITVMRVFAKKFHEMLDIDLDILAKDSDFYFEKLAESLHQLEISEDSRVLVKPKLLQFFGKDFNAIKVENLGGIFFKISI